jgi:hypothetical protein
VNWRDNPWFPDVLEAERVSDRTLYPDRYERITDMAVTGAFDSAPGLSRSGPLNLSRIAPDKKGFPECK